MNTQELVEWQKLAHNGLVYPWWTHPFLEILEEWDLRDVQWLEFGGGRSTAWLRSKCNFVDTIEANQEWANIAASECQNNKLYNGNIMSNGNLPDGVQEKKKEYFDLIIPNRKYDIISVDGIWRYECLQWALDHFKGRGGILIADNYDQDFVWISPPADELMKPYKQYEHIYIQLNHKNHEGKPWNTRYWNIPA